MADLNLKSVHKLTFRAKRWAPNPNKALPVIIKIMLHRTEEALGQLVREYELFLALQEFDLVCETIQHLTTLSKKNLNQKLKLKQVPRIVEFQQDRGLLVLEDPGGDAGEQAFSQCVKDSGKIIVA